MFKLSRFRFCKSKEYNGYTEPGATGYIEGIRMNGFSIPFGIIALPASVEGKIITNINSKDVKLILEEIFLTLSVQNRYDFSVGHLIKGKMRGNGGTEYNEKSLCVEIKGMDNNQLIQIGIQLKERFTLPDFLLKKLKH